MSIRGEQTTRVVTHRFVVIYVVLGAFTPNAGCGKSNGFASHAVAAGADEKVFLASVDGSLVVDVNHGELRIRKVEWAPDGSTYMIDGKVFPLDWTAVREKMTKLSVKDRLAVKSEGLHFDGRAVDLPRGVKMRSIWEAVLWNGWVLCLGRTSNTDKEANDRPPFFASELVAFKSAKPQALVRYLTFSPASETAIQILQGQPALF
jgi:hypothetical protein